MSWWLASGIRDATNLPVTCQYFLLKASIGSERSPSHARPEQQEVAGYASWLSPWTDHQEAMDN